MEERILTPAEALQLLSDNLAEETCRAAAYREAAISLIDHIAEEMAFKVREERDKQRESFAKSTILSHPSSATN